MSLGPSQIVIIVIFSIIALFISIVTIIILAKPVLKNVNDQICDYMAAAILLPREYMSDILSREQYYSMSKKEKEHFISKIAETKHVPNEVVRNRIYYITVLNSE